ncbi:hypothetical protein O4H49_02675 [Kiloniella laminariae]|uniref:Uncharacterized protein n=2 Tax=Kiloniella laminariae TaxID=454162 RepID=A0ABT4LEY7_9PROT|nr:hypothetical protein [Kiloniella laminariae]
MTNKDKITGGAVARRGLVMAAVVLGSWSAGPATSLAHDILSPVNQAVEPPFDIIKSSATTDGRWASFMMELAGKSGSIVPEATGAFRGAEVYAYVWPTKIDPSGVGFAEGSGILALAITAHPDFDDTPLHDENGDGDPANDGKNWHAHWAVLAEDAACGAGFKVKEISPGRDLVPATMPDLPIALDAPGQSPLLNDNSLKITLPVKGAEAAAFDAMTARLTVSQEGSEGALLCVTQAHDVASGDLSFPGIIMNK